MSQSSPTADANPPLNAEPVREQDATVKDAVKAFTRAGYGKTHAVKGPFYTFSVPVTSIDPALLKPDARQPPTPDDGAHEGAPREMRYFIAGCPISWSRSFTGRATTGYICYNLAEKDVCFMKDAWRLDDPNLIAEYQVYALLGMVIEESPDAEGLEEEMRGPVPYVPRLLCGGDLHNPDGSLQKTLAEVFEGGKKKTIQHYIHYRMVVKDVGQPLSTFKGVPELLCVLRDVVVAHHHAVRRGILHRDISAGHILITRGVDGKARGLLIDWDLCFVRAFAKADGDRWITGTWQFMSIALLSQRKNHRHSEKDDLESVFWVLCNSLVRYTNMYKGSDKSTVGHLEAYYDLAHPAPDHPDAMIGGETKMALLQRIESGITDAYFPAHDMPPPLFQLLSSVASSLLFFLRRRDCHQVVADYGSEPPKKGSYKELKYDQAVKRSKVADEEFESRPKFSHQSFRAFLDAAITNLSEIKPLQSLHGSMVVKDRLKAHREAEGLPSVR